MTVRQMRDRWAPTGKVILPFVGEATRSVPFPDGAWDIWAPMFSWEYLQGREPTLWIEIHGEDQWRSPKSWRADYLDWLLTHKRCPILMQERHAAVPASVRYPKELVQTQYQDSPFHGTMDWLLALAVLLQVTDIALWGAGYDTLHEELYQKPGACYWVGVARGRGIRVQQPSDSCLLDNPMPRAQTYGYNYPPWPRGHHPDEFPAHYRQEILL